MRRLLLSLLQLPLLCWVQGLVVLSLNEAEALWQQHSRELHLALSRLFTVLMTALYFFVATHPRLAKALH